MEISFERETSLLRLGEGETLRGEAIVAVAKAVLQSGVAYVGGYQGAPVSHLLDLLAQSRPLLDELGVKLSLPLNEAGAAALLGLSISHPLRGMVTWKSVVGTNVASDALSNLASAGVSGGALIVVGEDYGEGASIIQERTYAFALKSTLWLLDPRPNLPSIVRAVEAAFELSEKSHTPVMLQLRILACHAFGEFQTKENRRANEAEPIVWKDPAPFDYARLSHPPATFSQEHDKVTMRLPAARKYILDAGLNEVFPGKHAHLGIVVLGGLYNALIQQLARLGFSDDFGRTSIPILVLNVAYPLVPHQILEFCGGKDAVLVVEEGSPAFIEDAINAELKRARASTSVSGKDVFPATGEYRPHMLAQGILQFLKSCGLAAESGTLALARATENRARALHLLGSALPERPPTFCTGCPERPFFTALKMYQKESGPLHVAMDIGCHALATFPPFSSGNTILGYGMSLASAQAAAGYQKRRTISVMGDGGFWHNGLVSGVLGSTFNKSDSVLVILDNGYSSATGGQALPSSDVASGGVSGLSIERVLRAAGVRWIRTVPAFRLGRLLGAVRAAVTTSSKGLKVIIARGECQLARQRRLRKTNGAKLAARKHLVQTRFGVDEDICTGDRSCIRLSGCPSLTIGPRRDVLRTEPVVRVNSECVGCGLCGEVAHAARLCPSFYQADVVKNPRLFERGLRRLRRFVIRMLSERRIEVRQSVP